MKKVKHDIVFGLTVYLTEGKFSKLADFSNKHSIHN